MSDIKYTSQSAYGSIGSPLTGNPMYAPGFDLKNVSEAQALNNAVTGNIDYARAVAQAERAEKVSAAEAQKQRDFEERMSSTAYSRAISDLKKNGINPYAIGSFNAASTPSGAAGSGFSSTSASSGSNVTSYQTAYLRNNLERERMYLSAVTNLVGVGLSAVKLLK